MLLSQIISQIQYGELSQVILGDRLGLGVTSTDLPAIFNHINSGLLDLHTRFPLRREKLLIQQDPNIEYYYLRSKHAVSNAQSLEPNKYILDTDKPFKDNLLLVDKVKDLGVTSEYQVSVYPINNSGSVYNVDMPIIDLMIPPSPDTGSVLEVTYRASHPTLFESEYSEADTQIDLPISMMKALIFYIAAKSYSPMGLESAKNESNMYWSRYEAECALLKHYGMHVTENTVYDRLHDNGFV